MPSKRYNRIHTEFLSDVDNKLERLWKAHPEIFRRKPEKRIKTLTSIVRKINEPKFIDEPKLLSGASLARRASSRPVFYFCGLAWSGATTAFDRRQAAARGNDEDG